MRFFQILTILLLSYSRSHLESSLISNQLNEDVFSYGFEPEVIDEQTTEETYYGAIVIHIEDATLTLNDSPISSGTVVSEIGYYELKVNRNGDQSIIDFTIHPHFIGVIPNSFNDSTVSLQINASIHENHSFTLNGEAFTEFNEPMVLFRAGIYHFEFTGHGGYSGDFSFEIKGYLEGLPNTTEIREALTVTTNYATVKVNGEVWEDLNRLGTAGDNLIEFFDINDVLKETRSYRINPLYNRDLEKTELKGIIPFNIAAGEVLLNGESVSHDYVLTQPGYHQVMILGKNYSELFEFLLEPEILNVQQNAEYFSSIVPIISGGTLLLNDAPFASNQVIQEIGNYKLVIKGHDNYSKTLEFTIHPNFIGIDPNAELIEGRTMRILAYVNENHKFTLNGNDFNDFNRTMLYDKAGTYLFEYTGHRGYEGRFTFTMSSFIHGVTDGATYNKYPNISTNYARVTVNNNTWDDLERIGVAGDNVVRFYDINGNLKHTYRYRIEPEYNVDLQKSVIVGTVPFNITAGHVTLNGEPVDIDFELSQPGQHRVVISGNNYNRTFNFLLEPLISNVIHGQSYDQSIVPSISGGTLILNDLPYVSGERISAIGHHTLVINGHQGYTKVIEFTIHPRFTGVQNNARVNQEVNLRVDAAVAPGHTFLLNDMPFSTFNETTTISKAGTYRFEFTGPGNYKGTFEFVISSHVSGVTDGATYNSTVNITTNHAIVKLNGERIINYENIGVAGDNILTFYDMYEQLQETVFFIIEPTYNPGLKSSNLSGRVTLDISAGEVTLNGESVPNDQEVTEPGTYTVVITGNNYTHTITFDLHPEIKNIAHNQSYNESVMPIISGGEITHNDEPFSSGDTISKIGHHRIVIYGRNNYERIVEFTIHPKFVGLRGNLNDQASINQFEQLRIEGLLDETHLVTLNNVPINPNEIINLDLIGTYLLNFKGINDYDETFTFHVIPHFGILETQDSVLMSLDTVIFGGTVHLNGSIVECQNQDNRGCRLTADKIGNYELTVVGLNTTAVRNFVIEPKIIDLNNNSVESNKIFDEHYWFNIEGNIEEVRLNGTSITDTKVDYEYVGHYTLMIYGINGYLKTIQTTITLPYNQNYIQDNHVYAESMRFVFASENFNVPKVDLSKLVIRYTPKDVYTNQLNHMELIQNNAIDLEYENEFVDIGYYTVFIRGEGDYLETISFEIVPYILDTNYDLESVFKNHEFEAFKHIHPHTRFQVIDNDLTLVDQYLSSIKTLNLSFSDVGNHLVRIVNDTNTNFEEVISFVIESQLLDNDFLQVHAVFSIEFEDSHKRVLLNGFAQEEGQPIVINRHGKNTIMVEGLNGYFKTYEVYFVNPYREFTLDNVILLGIITSISAIGLLSRRGVKYD